MNRKNIAKLPVHKTEQTEKPETTGAMYTIPGHGKLLKYVGNDYKEEFIHIVDVSLKEAQELMTADNAFVFDRQASLYIRKAMSHIKSVSNRRDRNAKRMKEKNRRRYLKEGLHIA